VHEFATQKQSLHLEFKATGTSALA
jgi:hypothetical protein